MEAWDGHAYVETVMLQFTNAAHSGRDYNPHAVLKADQQHSSKLAISA